MGVSFNADETFEMAERIERNGAKFYRIAAESATEPAFRTRLLALADWEDQHERTFAAMRAELTEEERRPTVFDPDDENALYLAAMADRNVFDTSTDPAEILSGKETMADILKIAVGREKDSVVFYIGMRPYVPERLGTAKVDDIVQEEMGHIALLSQELRALAQ